MRVCALLQPLGRDACGASVALCDSHGRWRPGGPDHAILAAVAPNPFSGTCADGWSAYPGEPGKRTVWKPGLWGGCGREISVDTNCRRKGRGEVSPCFTHRKEHAKTQTLASTPPCSKNRRACVRFLKPGSCIAQPRPGPSPLPLVCLPPSPGNGASLIWCTSSRACPRAPAPRPARVARLSQKPFFSRLALC